MIDELSCDDGDSEEGEEVGEGGSCDIEELFEESWDIGECGEEEEPDEGAEECIEFGLRA